MPQAPAVAKRTAPRLGKHNNYVYREPLDKRAEEIAQLKKERHIGTEYLTEIIYGEALSYLVNCVRMVYM